MGLDRGVLARVDRRLMAGLGESETYRMVRVPVSKSKWLTWKSYCDSTGISMGRALAAMIDSELLTVLGECAGDPVQVLAQQAAEKLATRQEQIARRERDATAAEGRLRAWSEHLRSWEGDLEAREQRAELISQMSARPKEGPTKVGRNERCPCGSGLKYKHCHGLPGR
jgi:hypothetical protein